MYTCPMHPEIKSDKPGKCPICGGMDLVKESELAHAPMTPHKPEETYWPLIVIIGLLSLATLTLAAKDLWSGVWMLENSMAAFMAGFFLVFAGFKLLDLRGFVEGYSTYDLLAQRVKNYGYIYPFLELGLGLLYLVQIWPVFTNIATVLLLGFSGIGVARKLLRHEKFQCACLGTFLKVPLTKVTLIEDFGMAAMALVMLLMQMG